MDASFCLNNDLINSDIGKMYFCDIVAEVMLPDKRTRPSPCAGAVNSNGARIQLLLFLAFVTCLRLRST